MKVILNMFKVLGILVLMVSFLDSVTYESRAEPVTYSEWKEERKEERKALMKELNVSRSPAIVD